MSESNNPEKAPITCKLSFGLTILGFILLPVGVGFIALEDYYGISIGELVPMLHFLPESFFKYSLLISLLSFLCGLAFGLVGLDLAFRSKSRSGKLLSTISIIGFVFLLFVLKSVPGYTRFHSRQKQSEAKDGLRKIYEAEQDYFKKNGRYAKTFKELDLTELGNQRYTFFLSASESIQPTGIKKPYSLPQKYLAVVHDDNFQIIAIGNTNLNPEHDVWRINDKKQLFNVFDDVKGVENTPYP